MEGLEIEEVVKELRQYPEATELLKNAADMLCVLLASLKEKKASQE